MIGVFISLLAVASLASAEAPVVDCVTTDWEDSGSCSVTCGGGVQQRIRSVVTPAENGGACCGVLTKSISCNDEACPPPPPPPVNWVELNSGGCLDQNRNGYNYCSKTKASYTKEECQAELSAIDQTKVGSFQIQNDEVCIVDMISQSACETAGFDSTWNCICWNLPGTGPPVAYTGGSETYTCYVREAASAESADCALQESDDIFVKRAVMCGGEACIGIKNDDERTAVVWGQINMHDGAHAGDISTVDLTNVAQATCGYWECAVVKTDGSAQAWGQDYYNNGVDNLDLPSRRDITMIDCGHSACVALTSNGDALFWGGEAYMGALTPGQSVTGENFVDAGCGGSSCWGMKADSSVMIWGHYQDNIPAGALTDVKKIQCGGHKCVSITNQGRLYTWGSQGYGGLLEPRNVADAIIVDAMCAPYVCIAVSDQGELFTWGSWYQTPNVAPVAARTDVASAHCGYGACVVIKTDGTAISWGYTPYMNGYSGPYTNVKEAHCGGYLCVALKTDGSVLTWGPHWYDQGSRYSTLVSQGHLSSGSDIAKIQCGVYACLAVKSDGTVFTWGHSTYGGDSRNVDLTNMALDFPCESSTAGRRVLESQQLDDHSVAEQHALLDRLLRL